MKKGCLFLFLILGGLFAVFIISAIRTPVAESSRVGSVDKHGAWAYMQLFVEEKLKSPTSAEFPTAGYRHVTELGDNRFKVESYVDSENSFGATVRTNFGGVIKRVDEGWELESLTINE